MIHRRALHRLLALLYCSLAVFAGASEAAAPADSKPPESNETKEIENEKKQESDDTRVTRLDIETSSLRDLAIWARQLGLSEAGTVDDLRKRLLDYYKIQVPPQAKESGSTKTVVIEAARKTEYFTLESINEEFAILSGDVAVVFSDGKETHRIEASRIIYNKTLNTLHARGNVRYFKESENSIETFIGEAIQVDIENWQGLFIGGASERGQKGDTQVYRFTASTITRTDENVTVLEDTIIENAQTDEPYWSLTAEKIWLMPGSDWAIKNATLRVGYIPVFYLPFFYYPADKIFFNPVFGYRPREGAFFQTTTYLIGRSTAKSSSESSVMKILEDDGDSELKREGLFLVKTNEKRNDSEKQLALLVDMYSNLGLYAGVELSWPKTGILGASKVSGGIAFSRTVSRIDQGTWSPFIEDSSDESDWNSSKLFSFNVPFRYRLNTSGSLAFPNATINWSFPFYSDIYVDQDFMNRSEKMDWFNLMKSGTASLQESESIGTLGSYNWRLTVSGIKINTKPVNPWIQNINISSLSSNLTFNSRADPELVSSFSPSRTFFYPSTLNILSLSFTVSGRPLFFSSTVQNTTTKEQTPQAPSVDFVDPLAAIAPWDLEESETQEEQIDDPLSLVPPLLEQSFTSSSKHGSAELSYSISPSYSNDLVFNSQEWMKAEEIDWDDVASILNVARLTSTITGKLATAHDFLSLSLIFSGTGTWQEYLYMNEAAIAFDTESKRESEMLRNYRATLFSTDATLSLSGKPLALMPLFSNTAIVYTIKSLLAKSDFTGDAVNPNWEIVKADWTKETINTHSLALNLNLLLYDKAQTLSLNALLPPLDSKLDTNLSINWWKAVTSANMSIEDLDSDDLLFKPITLTQRFNISNDITIYQDIIIDPELYEFTQAVTNIKFKTLTCSFSALKTFGYDIVEGVGWVQDRTEEQFRPNSLALGHTLKRELKEVWNQRLTASIQAGSSLSLDFLRFTQSSFVFNLSTSLKINDFLEWSFSSRSQNSVLFRYIQDLPFLNLPIDLPGERNIFLDLFKSFWFWDEGARRSSGFKIKSLSTSLKHYMGDWNATLTYTLSPYLDRANREYRFENQISFLVQWVPFSEFKAETYENKDGLIFK